MAPLSVDAEPAFRTRHANPYNARLYTHVQQLGVHVDALSFRRLLVSPPDVVHLHWPELTFLSGHRLWRVLARLVLFFGSLSVARLRGTRLVWTVHNLAPHESRWPRWLTERFWSLFLSNVDGVLTLTPGAVQALRERYPVLSGVPAFVTPHGDYHADYDFSPSRVDARSALGLPADAPVIVFVGQLRSYKNVAALVTSFAGVPDASAVLGVAGSPADAELVAQVRAAAVRDPRVRLDLRFLPEEDMVAWLRAADLVALPFTAVLNSGSAILALTAGRPVLVPELGALGDLAAVVGPEWVHTYPGPLTSEVLADSLARAHALDPDAAPDLSTMDWGVIARGTVDAYESVCAASRPHHRTGFLSAARKGAGVLLGRTRRAR